MTNSRPKVFTRPNNRSNINELCTERCMSRRETLEQLLKLTKEVTSEFKKNKNVMPRKQINAFAPQNHMRKPKAQTTCLDGKPGLPVRMPPQKQRRVFGAPSTTSRGPALSPTNGCYAMTDLCKKMEREHGQLNKPIGTCNCGGCTGVCSSVGPHTHRNPADCLRDYCNYPCFKPPECKPNGNLWSGEVHTDCIHPGPCKADCFDHLPPRDWSNYMHRKG